MKRTLEIDVWSDVACPWCWIGKRRLEAAIAAFETRHAGDDVAIDVHWRAFELDTSAPRTHVPQGSYASRIAKKYGTSVEQAQQMLTNMTETAAAEGLLFDFTKTKPGNTFDAHRLIHFADHHDKQDAMKERLLRAYFSEGEHMADAETLVRLAAEVGLDADEARAMLASDAFAKNVRADETEARAMGVGGVPFFVIDRRLGVEGAQPAEVLGRVLDRAFADGRLERIERVSTGEAPICDDDVCAT
ncbi:MAG: 2-hydroxychromene-2-carboxylate isomerase/DsbA-like thioredoxin domain protein [Myxococcaceae bacterium]|jgi:predicted DsbA family dithiol-disulfide isomerase|nr:2-hydroxychromene-2-carboxylate isomerase/DsbA-like thioredoxin domain protein [Myxococcaceae bacterium]